MNIRAMSAARQRQLALALLGLLLALAYVLLAQPVANAFATQQNRIEKAEADLARWHGVIASESEIAAAATMINRDPRLQRGAIRASSDTQAAAGLQSLVRKSLIGAGADVRSSQILQATEAGAMRMVGVRVVVMADSEQFERAVIALDNSEPYLFIREADIQLAASSRRMAAETEAPTLQVRLDIFAFARPQE